MARLYGCNNLRDSSNMCHETTSVALNKLIGAPVGTTVPRTSTNATLGGWAKRKGMVV